MKSRKPVLWLLGAIALPIAPAYQPYCGTGAYWDAYARGLELGWENNEIRPLAESSEACPSHQAQIARCEELGETEAARLRHETKNLDQCQREYIRGYGDGSLANDYTIGDECYATGLAVGFYRLRKSARMPGSTSDCATAYRRGLRDAGQGQAVDIDSSTSNALIACYETGAAEAASHLTSDREVGFLAE